MTVFICLCLLGIQSGPQSENWESCGVHDHRDLHWVIVRQMVLCCVVKFGSRCAVFVETTWAGAEKRPVRMTMMRI